MGAESDTRKSGEKLIFIAILPLNKMVNDFLRQIFVLIELEFVPHFLRAFRPNLCIHAIAPCRIFLPFANDAVS